MIKILHTADIHLGAKLAWLEDKSTEQRKQLLKTFEKTINLAIEHQVDVYCVCGDLFDTSFPSNATISFVQNLFQKLLDKNIYVAVLPGNHDRLVEGSIFSGEFLNHKNFFLFNDKNIQKFDIPELNLSIYGQGVDKQFSKESPLKPIVENFNETKDKDINIALLHGSVNLRNDQNSNFPIEVPEIETSGFNYIALGDWHGLLEIPNKSTKAYYCGSPETLAIDQKKSGQVLLIEIGETGTKVRAVGVGATRIVEENIQIAELKKPEDQSKNYLNREIIMKISENATSDVIKIVNIKGTKPVSLNLDTDDIKEILKDRLFFLKINDRTKLELNDKDISKFPEELVVGRFIKEAKKALEKSTDPVEVKLLEDVIQEGVQRLVG